MKRTIRIIFLCGLLLVLAACSQPEVEPGLETVPTVEEPTQEPLSTATPIPATNTPAPTETATTVPTETPTEEPEIIEEETVNPNEDDMLDEMGEELAEMFGIEIISEGTLSMEALGVSFDLPEGWTGMQMMGLMMMATNTSFDSDISDSSSLADQGVMLMFIPTGGAPYEEMSNFTSEELMAEMGSANSDFDLEQAEVIEGPIPVIVNGYDGIRTTIQGLNEGEMMQMEITILEYEGLAYMMMTLGSPDELGAEQENLETLTNTLVLTPPDQAALEDAGEDMLDNITGGMVTEGRLDIPAIGISFEVPEGWTAMSMMGFMGMATNSSMELAMSDNQTQEGVVLMFIPSEGATIDEAWGATSEEMMASMTGPGSGIGEEELEILEEREPVIVNGYTGARTSMRTETEEGIGFIEMTILEHEGSTYIMMYAGNMADYDAEQANYEFLINSLILTEPDPEAVDFGDFGGGEDADFSSDLSLEADDLDVVKPLSLGETVLFGTDSNVGYETEVEIGSRYLIYLHGEDDTVLYLFPQDGEPIDFVDLRSDNFEAMLWTADGPSLTMAGSYFFDGGGQLLKLSIFKAADLESNSQTVTVGEGEAYFVMGVDEDYDVKLVVASESETFEVDHGFGSGSSEFVFLDEPGEYEISVLEWEYNEPQGTLFIVQLADMACCTLP